MAEFIQDTIAAISTPPGRGGIGIVRVAGPAALGIAARLLRLRRPLEHGRVRRAQAWPPATADAGTADTPLDDVMVTGYLAPASYTGDDLVEIAAHGSPVVLEAILSAALADGARLAEPGEFTQRAFLAGKLDLTQAEAVHDLIAAQTMEQARVAAQQMGGALSRRIAPAKEQLLHLIALLEAGMDFASGELDDVDVVSPEEIRNRLQPVQAALDALARSFRAGALLRSGLSLALVGRPNAGKSSLFNSLLERPRAIVTSVAGTTRDTVEESWSLQGIPVRLIDTAGLRLEGEAAADEAERIGMERSREALADADAVLVVQDATLPQTAEEAALLAELKGRPHLLVRNKVDLLGQPAAVKNSRARVVDVSALTGEGLPALRHALLELLEVKGAFTEGTLSNRRQQQAVLDAVAALVAAKTANDEQLPHEILLMELHAALGALDALTGATTADDILGRIFSTFCIGK